MTYAKKSLGQNFLNSPNIINRIIEAATLSKKDRVLEIGPGPGQLTFKIASFSEKVVAIEKDDQLADFLRKKIEENKIKNIEIINDDILKVNPQDYQDFKIIANLPYYISGQFLRIFLAHRHQNSFLMLQKEVAQRITAGPPNHSILSLSVQFYGQPKILFIVKANNFQPVPKIDSAFICISPNTDSINKTSEDGKYFFRTIKVAFSSKRKTLLNNLNNGFKIDKHEIEAILESLKINPRVRAQELNLNNYLELAKILENKK